FRSLRAGTPRPWVQQQRKTRARAPRRGPPPPPPPLFEISPGTASLPSRRDGTRRCDSETPLSR
ncbi:hypothetical protein M9458_024589, partial [Cirrhinus mrigala]